MYHRAAPVPIVAIQRMLEAGHAHADDAEPSPPQDDPGGSIVLLSEMREYIASLPATAV
jgi:hypothetical protein